MSFKVKYDSILGRMREKDGHVGPEPPAHEFVAATSPSGNSTYLADAETSPGLTVVVSTMFDGQLVDADAVPQGWTRTGRGTYSCHIYQEGAIEAQRWDYTVDGNTYSAMSERRTLRAIYPAYWGIYPSPVTTGDITAAVAALAQQHRVTSNLPETTVEVPNATGQRCWLWIVTRGSATAETFGLNMLEAPVDGKTFVSPMANWNLTGYRAYVSINPADPGNSFGTVKLKINL